MSGAAKRKRSSQGPFCIWQGMELPELLKLLRLRPPVRGWKSLRLVGSLGASLANSVMGTLERGVFGRRIANCQITQAPLFIIGHWRSGTTLLHTFFSRDPQFTYPNLYHTFCPAHFLLTERWLAPLTEWMLPDVRPMDNVQVGWNETQEDEIALCLMTAMSPYLMMAFYQQRDAYERFFDLRELAPQELDRWCHSFLFLLKKLTVRENKRLVLKSPTHTYRIPILLKLFPDAKFVYLVRNPYEVFLSSVHLRHKLMGANGFSPVDTATIEDGVLWTYERLVECYERDKSLIPPQNLREVRFEDLEANPLQELELMYKQFGFTGFEELKARLSEDMERHRDYRKNEYDLKPEKLRHIYERCRLNFDRFGYESQLPLPSPAVI